MGAKNLIFNNLVDFSKKSKILEKEEEFLDDYNSFLDELCLSENDCFRKKEVLNLDETYYDIPVRIKKIYKNYAFGEISNMNNVYISKNFIYNLWWRFCL